MDTWIRLAIFALILLSFLRRIVKAKNRTGAPAPNRQPRVREQPGPPDIYAAGERKEERFSRRASTSGEPGTGVGNGVAKFHSRSGDKMKAGENTGSLHSASLRSG